MARAQRTPNATRFVAVSPAQSTATTRSNSSIAVTVHQKNQANRRDDALRGTVASTSHPNTKLATANPA